MSLCWHSHPRSQAFVASVFSNSVGGLGKSSSRFHAHFSSKDPSWPCSDKLADKMDGARRWIFQNLGKHICIYIYISLSLHLVIIFVIHTFLVYFMSSSWPDEWSALWFFHVHQCQGDNILVWSLIQMTQKQEEFNGMRLRINVCSSYGQNLHSWISRHFFRLIREFAAAGCSMP